MYNLFKTFLGLDQDLFIIFFYKLSMTCSHFFHNLPPTRLWLDQYFFDNLSNTSAWLVNNWFSTCSWLGYNLFTTWSQLVHYLIMTCQPILQFVHNLFYELFTSILRLVLFMINRLRLAYDFFTTCSSFFHDFCMTLHELFMIC